MRTLYVAQSGAAFAAWWDREPPPPPHVFAKRWPSCPPPDVYLLGAYGVDPFLWLAARGELPCRDEYRRREISCLWAERGVRLAIEAARAKRKEQRSAEQPALFRAEHIAPVEHPVRKTS